MTRLLTCAFIALWFAMGFIELFRGDLFHTVTSFTISVWNFSFLRDMIRLEKTVSVEKTDAEV